MCVIHGVWIHVAFLAGCAAALLAAVVRNLRLPVDIKSLCREFPQTGVAGTDERVKCLFHNDINMCILNNRILFLASIYLSCCIYIPDVLHLYIQHAGAIYPARCSYISVLVGSLIRRVKHLFFIISCNLFVILKQRDYFCRSKYR